MILLPGIHLQRHAQWTALEFERELPVLSSAPVGGGDVRARRVVNLCVTGPDARSWCDDPDAVFAQLAAEVGWTGHSVGLMTGVGVERTGIATDEDKSWAALATVGVGNAHRAGDPAAADLDAPPAPGTINIVAVTTRGLTAAARAEAIALTAEAKASLLVDSGITAAGTGRVATGTGTDAIAIVCAGHGDTRYTGYHTHSGRALVAAVRAAMQASLAAGAAPSRESCGALE